MANIFIDLDGTLLDNKKRLYFLFKKNAQREITFERYIYLRLLGNSNSEILQNEFKYDNDFINNFISLWMNEIELENNLALDTLFPFSYSSLLGLKELGFHLFLTTNRQNRKNTIAQLERLSILPLFKEIVITEQKNCKSALIKKTLNNISKFDILVGDTIDDIIEGKKLDISTVAVETGLTSKNDLLEMKPTLIVNNIADLYLKLIDDKIFRS